MSKRYLNPVYTCHARNDEADADVYGYIYERPVGAGFHAVVEVRINTEDGFKFIHPALPQTFATRAVAVESLVEQMIDFDWDLGHPWMEDQVLCVADAFEPEDFAMKMIGEVQAYGLPL